MVSRWNPETADRIAAKALAAIKARTKLTDVRPNGPLAQIVQSTAEQIEPMHTGIAHLELLNDLEQCSGEDLDARGAEVLPSGLQRDPATKAEGWLEFERDNIVGAVTIAAGSRAARVEEGRQIVYHTVADGTIAVGDTKSGDIAAVCSEAGEIGNVSDSGAVTILISQVVGVNAVSNPAGFSGGNDLQSDPEYRQAIRDYVRGLGRCHESGVLAEVRKVTFGEKSVRFARIFDWPGSGRVRVVVDDGRGTAGQLYAFAAGAVLLASALGGEEELSLPYWPCKGDPVATVIPGPGNPGVTATVYGAWGKVHLDPPLSAGDQVTYGSYLYWTGLLVEVQKRINGDPSDSVNYPGCRALQGYLVAEAAIRKMVEISGTLVIEDYAPVDSTKAAAQNAVLAYVNSLGIGAPRYRAKIVAAVMGVPGVLNFYTETETEYVEPDVVQRTTPSRVDLGIA